MTKTCLLCIEQEKEESGEFHSLQGLGSDLAAEGEPGYANGQLLFWQKTNIFSYS